VTAIHQDPVYIRNSRHVRKVLTPQIEQGEFVPCVECGRPVHAGQRWDVSHIVAPEKGGTHDLSNLGAGHRRCNRSSGGQRGAAISNRGSRRARRLPSWWL
jgi:hypothetical protein